MPDDDPRLLIADAVQFWPFPRGVDLRDELYYREGAL